MRRAACTLRRADAGREAGRETAGAVPVVGRVAGAVEGTGRVTGAVGGTGRVAGAVAGTGRVAGAVEGTGRVAGSITGRGTSLIVAGWVVARRLGVVGAEGPLRQPPESAAVNAATVHTLNLARGVMGRAFYRAAPEKAARIGEKPLALACLPASVTRESPPSPA